VNKFRYVGLDAFGEDTGSVWSSTVTSLEPFNVRSADPHSCRKLVRRLARGKPVIWFIDDEKVNRDWFRDYHRGHFVIITFSKREYFEAALDAGLRCDAVVTDIFFPAEYPRDTDGANSLLSVYEKIGNSKVSGLAELWTDEKSNWKLDGFTIAKLIVEKRPQIPVFLFSRKATLLLSIADIHGEMPAVRNSYWLIEKPDPACDKETARRAADIQRARILAVIRLRASWWKKILRSLRIGPSPSIEVKELIDNG